MIASWQLSADEIDQAMKRSVEALEAGAKRLQTDFNTPWRKPAFWNDKEPLKYQPQNRKSGMHQGTALGRYNDIDGFIQQCEINEAEMSLYKK
mmetsp:Transcript_39984/g.125146  ORF Transcript_39984/g.125146 Transcript_39984/m.125146 type:complete len:93 (+) Transcript_39984:329-607(+)